MMGEASSVVYASQKVTKSASGLSTSGGSRDPSGMVVETMEGVVIMEGVATLFVIEV